MTRLEQLRNKRIHRTDVKQCARCGDDHDQLVFYKFTDPIYDSNGNVTHTHYASCPNLKEPIIMRFMEDQR